MRDQKRDRPLPQKAIRDPSEQPFSHSRVAIASHHEKIGAELLGCLHASFKALESAAAAIQQTEAAGPTTLESVLPQIGSVKRRRRRGIGFGCKAHADTRMFFAPFHFWRAISSPHHGPGSSLSNKGSRIIFARGASSRAFLRSTS